MKLLAPAPGYRLFSNRDPFPEEYMNKKITIGAIIFCIALGLTAFPAVPPAAAAGVYYQQYLPENFEKTKNLKRVLFFYAPWCSGCHQTHQQLISAHLPDGVVIFKIDYDSATVLRKAYGVPY